MSDVKFLNKIDEEILTEESKRNNISLEELVEKKKEIELGLTDFERSQMQKERWRTDRWKYMKGIHKFHRSTAGKQFHRNLGTYLTTREFEGSLASYQKARDGESNIKEHFDILNFKNIIDENREFIIAITSVVTHALIEKRYLSSNLNEEVDYNIFLGYLIDRYLDTMNKVIEGKEKEIDYEFWKKVIVNENQ